MCVWGGAVHTYEVGDQGGGGLSGQKNTMA